MYLDTSATWATYWLPELGIEHRVIASDQQRFKGDYICKTGSEDRGLSMFLLRKVLEEIRAPRSPGAAGAGRLAGGGGGGGDKLDVIDVIEQPKRNHLTHR